MFKKNGQGLQYVLCPARNPAKEYLSIYNEIYSCWYKLWSSAYAEIKDPHCLTADAFTRQDYIGAVLKEGTCQSFVLYKHVDISLPATLQDSYFKQWSDLHIERLAERGKNLMICGNFGIIPSARGDSLGFSVKELMLGLTTELCLHTKADGIICTPRQDKNVHGGVYKWGGIAIARDIHWGLNVTVDLTAFYREEVLKHRDHSIIPLVEELWSQKLVIPEFHLEPISSLASPDRRQQKAG